MYSTDSFQEPTALFAFLFMLGICRVTNPCTHVPHFDLAVPPSALTRLSPLCLVLNPAPPHLSPYLLRSCFQSCIWPTGVDQYRSSDTFKKIDIPFHCYSSEQWPFHWDSKRPPQAPQSLLSVHMELLQLQRLCQQLTVRSSLKISRPTLWMELPGGVQR